VPKTAALMQQRGITGETIRLITFQNAVTAFAQSAQLSADELLSPLPVDPANRYGGSSVLRGGQTVIE
jgi:uncharacterized protein